jgi:hypothetical protein
MHSCYPNVGMSVEIKTVGSSGQISLGKENAGRTVMVEQVDEGTWVIKAARVIPETELWLHTPAITEVLSRSIRWAEKHPPRKSNLAAVEKKLKRRR